MATSLMNNCDVYHRGGSSEGDWLGLSVLSRHLLAGITAVPLLLPGIAAAEVIKLECAGKVLVNGASGDGGPIALSFDTKYDTTTVSVRPNQPWRVW